MTQDSKSNMTVPTPSAPNSVSNLAERLKAKTQQEAAVIQNVTQSELALHQQHLRDLSTSVVSSTVTAIESSVQKAAWSLEATGKEAETTLRENANLVRSTGQQVSKTLTALQTDLETKGDVMRTKLDGASESLGVKLAGVETTAVQLNNDFVKAANKTVKAVNEQQSELREEVAKQTKQLIWLMKIPMLLVVAVSLLACFGVWGWTEYRMSQAEQREAVADLKVRQLQQRTNQLTQEFCATPAGRKSCSYPNR